jgi:hypothetical protein
VERLNTESKITLAFSLIALVISGAGFWLEYHSWSMANNYPPSVEIRDTSALFLDEHCSPADNTTKDCALSGEFSVSLGITSPRPGTYNFSIISFYPTTTFTYFLNNVSFLGKNLTLIEYFVGSGSYLIKVRNETSGHFIYFENIGGQPPGETVFKTPMEIARNPEGNVPANGFEKTVNITVRAQISRPFDYKGFSRKVQAGTLNCELTYFDIPANQRLQRFFEIEVWINPSSG